MKRGIEMCPYLLEKFKTFILLISLEDISYYLVVTFM